jgi:hypothetical protein
VGWVDEAIDAWGSFRDNGTVAISRAERRAEREARACDVFGSDASAALELFELTELAWHDCYGEVTPPEAVIDNMFISSGGSVATLAKAARVAVADYRDLWVWAEQVRRTTM